MSTPGPVAGTPSGLAGVRLAKSAVEKLRSLPPRVAAAVARTIQRIGVEPGVPLRIEPAGDAGKPYMVMLPSEDDTPVVIYRELSPDEEGQYLVTALSDREAYEAYQKAEQEGFLDNPASKALLMLAVGAAAVIALRAATRGGQGL